MKPEMYHLKYSVQQIKIFLKALPLYEKDVSKGMVLLEPGNLLYAIFIKS